LGGDQMPVDKPVNKAAASAQMLVNEAIDEAVDAAVTVKLEGGVGATHQQGCCKRPNAGQQAHRQGRCKNRALKMMDASWSILFSHAAMSAAANNAGCPDKEVRMPSWAAGQLPRVLHCIGNGGETTIK
jgi:hypothetical protein